MKLKKEFILHETDDEQIMIAVGNAAFTGLVRSNKTAAQILNCLKQECSKEQIVEKMNEKYDMSKEIIATDVEDILDKLKKIGALEE